MKREFGKKLIEEYLPRWDLTHVIDTSVAYIPGHGTPTVILLGKNQPPVSGTIRTVLGIRGEETTPDDPATAPVWQAIVQQIDEPGSVSKWVSAGNSPRANFHSHPWSIGGGGAMELKEQIEVGCVTILAEVSDQVGVSGASGEDELYLLPDEQTKNRLRVERSRPLILGDGIRDWSASESVPTLWPYDNSFKVLPLSAITEMSKLFWLARTVIVRRKPFGIPIVQRGMAWYEWQELYTAKFQMPLTITWGEVATHNHFALDRGGKVFKNTAPVIKLKSDATESDFARLLGVLNSSTGCFWLQQVCHNKGGPGGGSSKDEKWHDFYALNSTKIACFPLPENQPTQLPTALVQTSTALQAQSPAATLASWSGPESDPLRTRLATARDQATRLRRQLIAWQEELDWQIYEAFGLVEGAAASGPAAVSLPEGSISIPCPNGASSSSPGLRGTSYPVSPVPQSGSTPTGLRHSGTGHNPVGVENLVDDEPRVGAARQPWAGGHSPVGAGEPGTVGTGAGTPAAATFEVPPLELGERAFEIVLARRMGGKDELGRMKDEGGEPFQTTWFARHGSTPITEIPGQWPKEYRELVERRIQRIADDPSIRLIEQPEYKRRWNTEPWDDQLETALEKWLLDRIERAIGRDLNAQEGSEAAKAYQPKVELFTTQEITDLVVQTDFREAAEIYRGRADFDPHALVAELIQSAAVPFLPGQRYKETGLRKRAVWEETWDKQRAEDAIDEQVGLNAQNPSDTDRKRLEADAKARKAQRIGDIPVPPKYDSKDFRSSTYWSLRGKLDVPKERFISYPGCSRDGDPCLTVAWAGLDHLQQAKALAAHYGALQQTGAGQPKLILVLAGLNELLSWLKQWHNQLDPEFGLKMGDYYEEYVREEAKRFGKSLTDLKQVAQGFLSADSRR